MKTMNQHCDGMESKLATMLLDPVAVPAKVQDHVAECSDCSRKLEELHATIALLDEWAVPEPSASFVARLNVRLRDERNAAPAGWFARQLTRLQASIAYGPGSHVRPLAAMALTVLLLIGGGAYLDTAGWDKIAQPPSQTAVVHDLQTLDNNAQLLDQLEALSSNDNGN